MERQNEQGESAIAVGAGAESPEGWGDTGSGSGDVGSAGTPHRSGGRVGRGNRADAGTVAGVSGDRAGGGGTGNAGIGGGTGDGSRGRSDGSGDDNRNERSDSGTASSGGDAGNTGTDPRRATSRTAKGQTASPLVVDEPKKSAGTASPKPVAFTLPEAEEKKATLARPSSASGKIDADMVASLIVTGFRFYGTTRPIHVREAWDAAANFPNEIRDIAEPAARIIARLPAKHYKTALQIIDPACLLIAAFGLYMACSSLEIALHNEYLKSNPQSAKGFNAGQPTANAFETSAFNGHPASNGTGAGGGNSSDFPDSSAARLHLYTQGPNG